VTDAENEGEVPSTRDLTGALALLVVCLAQYFAGPERSQLIAWLEKQAALMEKDGVQEVHLRYIRATAEALRMGRLQSLYYDLLRPPADKKM
jgi:flagellar biosynthesis protein FlhB